MHKQIRLKIKNSFMWLYTLPRSTRKVILGSIDAIVVSFCFNLAVFIRTENFQFLASLFNSKTHFILIIITVVVFKSNGLYRSLSKFFSVPQIEKLLISIVISSSSILALGYFFNENVPKSLPVIFGGLLFLIIFSFRSLMSHLHNSWGGSAKQNIIAYGVTNETYSLINQLSKDSFFRVVGILDPRGEYVGSEIENVRVYHFNDLHSLCREHEPKALVASSELIKSRVDAEKIMHFSEKHQLRVIQIPTGDELINLKTDGHDHSEMVIDTLLSRPKVDIGLDGILTKLRGTSILVSGAGGTIGSELCRQIIELEPEKIILVEISEFALYSIVQVLNSLNSETFKSIKIIPIVGSIADRDLVERIFSLHKVDIVFNAAAYKHVPLLEDNILSGLKNNIQGSRVLLRTSKAHDVRRFIQISSDKAVRPTNVMGASKRVTELICGLEQQTSTATKICAVRFGNVLGSSGSVVPLFIEQMERGGPVTVTHPDIERYFMTVTEAVTLVIQASGISKGGEIFILDMGEPIKILDLAKKLITLRGKKTSNSRAWRK